MSQASTFKDGVNVNKDKTVRRELPHSSKKGRQSQGQMNASKLDGLVVLTDTAQRVSHSTGEALKRITSGESERLNLSNRVTTTAQRVAKSTGEVLERVKTQTEMQSLNLSDQLATTAQRVARSTGKELERVKATHQEEERLRQDSLDMVQETAARVARSTGEALEEAAQGKQPEGISMLQQAELAAERVARSTGHALQRLGRDGNPVIEDRNTPRHKQIPTHSGTTFKQDKVYQTSTPPHNIRSLSSLDGATKNEAQRSETEGRRLHSLPSATKQASMAEEEPEYMLSASVYTGYRGHDSTVLRHVKGAKKTQRRKNAAGSESSSSEYSTTESLDIAPGHRSRSLLAHRQSVVNDPDLNESPLQRMTHTAELVAASTGQAVVTLTSSLLS